MFHDVLHFGQRLHSKQATSCGLSDLLLQATGRRADAFANGETMTTLMDLQAITSDALDKISGHLQAVGTTERVLKDLYGQAEEGITMIHATIVKLQKTGAKGTKLADFKSDKAIATYVKSVQTIKKQLDAKLKDYRGSDAKTAQFVKILKVIDSKISAAAKDQANAKNGDAIKSLIELRKVVIMCEQGLEEISGEMSLTSKGIDIQDTWTIKQLHDASTTTYITNLSTLAGVRKKILQGQDKVSGELKAKFDALSKAVER